MPNIVKNTTIINPLDLLIPHSCRGCGAIGSALCKRCKNHIFKNQYNFCPNCKQATDNGICHACIDLPPTYIGGERTGLLDAIIHDYKYHSIRALAKPLAEILLHALPQPDHPVRIIPLPTAHHHIRARGFDHMKLIAKHLEKSSNHHYIFSPLIERITNTTQVGHDRATRLIQAKSAYQLSNRAHLDLNSTYLLIDDVWTTGASMRACIKILQQAGANNLMLGILALSRLS